MEKAKNYFQLTRPQNNLIAALAVLVGALIGYPVVSFSKLFLACLSASFISAGGYVMNDYFDLEIDRINKPERPLPKEMLSKKSALLFSLLLFGIGLVLSVLIKLPSFILAFISSFLLILYSAKLKKRLFIGNLTVSTICALAFLYGGLVGSDFTLSFIPAGFAYLFHLGREILKDVEDLKGDKSVDAKTIPIFFGEKKAFLFITFIFSTLILLTLAPYVFNVFSIFYLLLVVLAVDSLLLFTIISMWRDSSEKNLSRLSRILKWDMILGLLAIFVGRIQEIISIPLEVNRIF